jgi:hypothetical protein
MTQFGAGLDNYDLYTNVSQWVQAGQCPTTRCGGDGGSGNGKQEICSQNLPAGTYILGVRRVSGTGNYSLNLTCSKVPEGGPCLKGDDCLSGLCIEGYCRAACNYTYSYQRCSNDTLAYDTGCDNGLCKLCWNASSPTMNCTPAISASPPGSNFYAVDTGNTLYNDSWADYSDQITISQTRQTKTGSLTGVKSYYFYKNSTGSNSNISGTFDYSTTSQTYSSSFFPDLGFTNYSFWGGAVEPCCYNFTTTGVANLLDSMKLFINFDDINLSTPLLSSSSRVLTATFDINHNNTGATSNVNYKCKLNGDPQVSSDCYSNNVAPGTGKTCNINNPSCTGDYSNYVKCYAQDSSSNWIDTDTSVQSTIFDPDNEQKYCDACVGTGSWTNSNWYQVDTSGTSPGNITQLNMVYDSDADRIIEFGGQIAGPVRMNETWLFNRSDNKWYNVTQSGSPSKRDQSPAMVYDPFNKRTILFGGYDGTSRLDDTWAFNYADLKWYNMNPSVRPTMRGHSSMVYVSSRKVMVLFGGTSIGTNRLADTWAYNYSTNTWYNITNNTNPKCVPTAREEHYMAYDSNNDRIIMYGGYDISYKYLNDTWEFNYTDICWYNITKTAYLPLGRNNHKMVYENESQRVILFGGATSSSNWMDDTWEFNYTDKKWYQMDIINRPPARQFSGMTYDSKRDKIVIYGGDYNGNAPRYNDTWILEYSSCCGDDPSENWRTEIFGPSMYGSSKNTNACCDASTDCVNASKCYPSGTSPGDIDGNGDSDYCLGGTWVDCNDNSQCQSGWTCQGNDCAYLNYLIIQSINISYWNPSQGAWIEANPDIPPIEARNRTMNVTVNITNSSTINNCSIRIFNGSGSYSNPTIGPINGTFRMVGSQTICNSTWNMEYWRNNGQWNVSVNVSDTLTNFTSKNFTYTKLPSAIINVTFINFTGFPGTNVTSTSAYPLSINNSGNIQVNVSINGSDLINVSYPTYAIKVGNITYNETKSGISRQLTYASYRVFSFLKPREEKYIYFNCSIPLGSFPIVYNNTINITGEEA